MAKFTETLSNLRHGQAEQDLDEALTEAVQRARDTGKKATVSITVTIEPKGASGQYFLTDEVKSKLPSFAKEKTILFGTPDGNLLRDDPHQQKLPLRELDEPTISASKIRNVHDLPVAVKQMAN